MLCCYAIAGVTTDMSSVVDVTGHATDGYQPTVSPGFGFVLLAIIACVLLLVIVLAVIFAVVLKKRGSVFVTKLVCTARGPPGGLGGRGGSGGRRSPRGRDARASLPILSDNNNNDNDNNNNNDDDDDNNNNNDNIIIVMIMMMMMMMIIIIIIIIIIIALKGAIRDFLQSPHCAANRHNHVRSSGPVAIVCKSRALHRALITCNM